MFVLDSRLAADTLPIARLALSRVLLMNDRRYPWLILVPERPGARDLIDLDPSDQQTLTQEIARTCQAWRVLVKPDKLNVAALGNMVPQLHVHVIARFGGDDAWPKPVWGVHPPLPYDPAAADDLRVRLIKELVP